MKSSSPDSFWNGLIYLSDCNTHFCLGNANFWCLGCRQKARSDSGWRTRLWGNWTMLRSSMAWPERRLYINAEESWTQRWTWTSFWIFFLGLTHKHSKTQHIILTSTVRHYIPVVFEIMSCVFLTDSHTRAVICASILIIHTPTIIFNLILLAPSIA